MTITGFCFRCKDKRDIKDAQIIKTNQGEKVTGVCSICGTKMYKNPKKEEMIELKKELKIVTPEIEEVRVKIKDYAKKLEIDKEIEVTKNRIKDMEEKKYTQEIEEKLTQEGFSPSPESIPVKRESYPEIKAIPQEEAIPKPSEVAKVLNKPKDWGEFKKKTNEVLQKSDAPVVMIKSSTKKMMIVFLIILGIAVLAFVYRTAYPIVPSQNISISTPVNVTVSEQHTINNNNNNPITIYNNVTITEGVIKALKCWVLNTSC